MRWVISALAVALVATALIPPASAGTPQRKLCPRAGPHFPEVDRGDQFRIKRLEGKIMRRARRIARKHDCVVRVVRRDGRWLIVTADLRGDRVNVAVEGRRVVRAYETS